MFLDEKKNKEIRHKSLPDQIQHHIGKDATVKNLCEKAMELYYKEYS